MSDMLPWWWRWAALAAICAASWGHGYVTGLKDGAEKLATCKADAAAVKERGQIAEQQAEARIFAEKNIKKDADDENARTTADLRARLERLRHANTNSNLLPAAAPGSSRPELACYDRAELERAAGSLLADIRGIADEGSQATIDLNTARAWAAKLKVAESMAVR